MTDPTATPDSGEGSVEGSSLAAYIAQMQSDSEQQAQLVDEGSSDNGAEVVDPVQAAIDAAVVAGRTAVATAAEAAAAQIAGAILRAGVDAAVIAQVSGRTADAAPRMVPDLYELLMNGRTAGGPDLERSGDGGDGAETWVTPGDVTGPLGEEGGGGGEPDGGEDAVDEWGVLPLIPAELSDVSDDDALFADNALLGSGAGVAVVVAVEQPALAQGVAGGDVDPSVGSVASEEEMSEEEAAAFWESMRPAHHAKRWWLLLVLGLAQLMIILDGTIINVALPTAQHALHFSNADRQWVITAYSLAFGSLLLIGGKISDWIGRRRALVIGLVGFAGASMAGGLATNFTMLVVARGVQGMFAALLAPTVLVLLATTFMEPHERGRAFAIYGSIAGAGGAIGLLLGGALTSYASWRWTLFINLFFAVIAIIGTLVILKKDQFTYRAPTSWLSVVSVTAGLFLVVLGLSHAETTSWRNHYTMGALGLGVALLLLFAVLQTIVKHPLLPPRVVRHRNRTGSFLAMLFAGAGLFGVLLFLTYYMQGTLGYSPVKAGVAFVPMVFALALMSQLSSRVLLPRMGPKPLIPTGMVMLGTCMYMLSRLTLASSYSTNVLPYLILAGLGFGLVITPAINTATSEVELTDAAVASATVTTSQQIGGSIGTALLNTLAASAATAYLIGKPLTRGTVAGASLHSYTTTFFWSAVIFFVGAVVCGIVLATKPSAPWLAKAWGRLIPTLVVVAALVGSVVWVIHYQGRNVAEGAVPQAGSGQSHVAAPATTTTTTPVSGAVPVPDTSALSLQDGSTGYGQADPVLTQLGGDAASATYEVYSSTVTPAGGVPAYLYTETAAGYWSPTLNAKLPSGTNSVGQVLGPASTWGSSWAATSSNVANAGAEAPGVYLYHGQWIMFFHAARNQGGTASTRTTCIAEATAPQTSGASAPVMAFTFSAATKARPLICQDPYSPKALVSGGDLGGSLDAQPFTDPVTGLPWLVWKSAGGSATSPYPALWAVALDPATGTTPVGTPFSIMTLGSSAGWKHGVIEAPDLAYSHGSYILYYSGGQYTDSSYGIGYATCSPSTSSASSVAGFGPGSVCTDRTPTTPLVGTGISATTTTGSVELYGPGSSTQFVDHWGREGLAFSAYTTPGVSPTLRYLFVLPLSSSAP